MKYIFTESMGKLNLYITNKCALLNTYDMNFSKIRRY